MGGFGGVVTDLGKAAYEGLKQSGVGGAVFSAGEKVARDVGEAASSYAGKSKVGQYLAPKVESMSQAVQNMAAKTFGLESQLTGPTGAKLNEHLKIFEKEFDKQQAIHLKEAKINPQHPMFGQPEYEIKGYARRVARINTFGKNDALLAQHLNNIAIIQGEEKAKNIADGLGVYFHDAARKDKGAERTELTSNLYKNPLTRDIDFRNSPYNPVSDTERAIQSATHTVLAFKAGLAHLSTPLNLLLGQSLSSFGKASTHLFGGGYAGARAEMLSLNAIGSAFMEEAEQHYKFQNGLIKEYAPGSVGEFISKNWQIPGMSALRQRTMTMAAMQGKYSAMEAATTLLDQDASHKAVELAEENLRYHGIDPDKIRTQNGQLMPEDIRSAMYENVNRRVFISTGRNRAPIAVQNSFGRLIGMYHSYAAAQSKFIQKEVMRSIQRGNPAEVAKTFATLGIIFPAVGAAIAGLEQFWMGKPDAIENTKEQEANILNPGGFLDGKNFADRLDGILHVAGFGVMSSYTRAAGRRKLINTIAGPTINAGAELIQDAYAAGKGIATGADRGKDEYKAKTWAPLARDILHDVPSLGVGAWASEHFFPTQQQLNKQKPMTKRRLAAQRAAARKKARLEASK